MDDLKLEHLHTFAKVVEHGTFSHAAKRLNLTQPAVSLHVRHLEKRLGVRLLERVGKRVTPTAAGSELLGHIRRIDDAVDAALDAMAAYTSGAFGRIRIGTGGTACTYLLPPILKDLKQRYPDLEISVRTGNSPDILKEIEENILDAGLVTMPAPGRMFEVTPVLKDPIVAVFASEETGIPDVVTPASLANLPVVLYESGSNTRTIIDQWFSRAEVSIVPVMNLGNVEAIKEMVGAGLGCALLPGSSVRKQGDRNPILSRPVSPELFRTLALVTRKDKILNKGLRAMIDALLHLA